MAEAQAPKPTVPAKITRSPKGLVDALFDSLDRMNEGAASVEEVRATSHTARAICNVARIELEAAKLAESFGRNVALQSLPGLGTHPKLVDAGSGTP